MMIFERRYFGAILQNFSYKDTIDLENVQKNKKKEKVENVQKNKKKEKVENVQKNKKKEKVEKVQKNKKKEKVKIYRMSS
jgi:hypothetical protein